jgi:uncharacterized protein YqgC (DUF456 family)
MAVFGDLLLMVFVLTGWVGNLLSLPGNWLIVVAAAMYAWLMPGESRGSMDWVMVGVLAGIAVLAEIAETGLSAVGVKRAGGSRAGAIFALFGSIIGAIAGLFVGVPIPIVGSLIAALLLAGVGAWLGATVGESLVGKNWRDSTAVGNAAFRGRMFGTAVKVLFATVMAGIAFVAPWIR